MSYNTWCPVCVWPKCRKINRSALLCGLSFVCCYFDVICCFQDFEWHLFQWFVLCAVSGSIMNGYSGVTANSVMNGGSCVLIANGMYVFSSMVISKSVLLASLAVLL